MPQSTVPSMSPGCCQPAVPLAPDRVDTLEDSELIGDDLDSLLDCFSTEQESTEVKYLFVLCLDLCAQMFVCFKVIASCRRSAALASQNLIESFSRFFCCCPSSLKFLSPCSPDPHPERILGSQQDIHPHTNSSFGPARTNTPATPGLLQLRRQPTQLPGFLFRWWAQHYDRSTGYPGQPPNLAGSGCLRQLLGS